MFRWPAGVRRIPDEEWTRAPAESLAQKYDAVGKHGWYDNLDPTVEELAALLREGDVVVDYSGGTGLLIDRLLAALPGLAFGVVNVDSSPKFLAMSVEKLRDEPRVAFRLLRFLKDEKRLQTLEEALDAPLRERGLDAVVSTNAIHLYHDLVPTLRSWARLLRPEGRVLAQSGNVRHPGAREDAWIIDDTVEAAHDAALRIARQDARFAAYRDARPERYEALRRRFFLPPRPLATYLDAMKEAGLAVTDVRTRRIRARTHEWYEFLAVYHEGILPWVGGVEKVDGAPPTAQAVEDRKRLLRLALDEVLEGQRAFDATWTYITAKRA